jgi:RNA polymerase sigma-70 factor (ECF subfamily)
VTEVEAIAGVDGDAADRADVDGALALRAGHGDRAAFAELVSRNYQRIHRIAAKWCGGTAEAEDVAQNVCVKLAGAVSSYDARARFSSWLYRVVLNEVRDGQRQRSRQVRRDSAYAQSVGEAVSGGQEDDVLALQLWDAVRTLPAKQRDAVLLVYAEEQSHAAAAEVMGCSEATVSWHVHEARKALKGVLE